MHCTDKRSECLCNEKKHVSQKHLSYHPFSSNFYLRNVPSFLPSFSYSQEIPSRFRKDIIKAADFNRDGFVSFHEVQDFMQNIGVKDVVTTKELETVFLEAGAHLSSEEENNQDRTKVNNSSSISSMVLPVDRMVDLFWCDVKDKHHDRPKAA